MIEGKKTQVRKQSIAQKQNIWLKLVGSRDLQKSLTFLDWRDNRVGRALALYPKTSFISNVPYGTLNTDRNDP